MVNPSPVPPNFRVVDPSAGEGSKFFLGLPGMPIPVSRTENRTVTTRRPGGRGTPGRPPPRSVNLTAFPTRLTRIWRSRPGSPRRAEGSSGRPAKWLDPLGVGTLRGSITSSTTPPKRSKGVVPKLHPAGLDPGEVEMSLMISSSASPERRTIHGWRWSPGRLPGGVCRHAEDSVHGVRISWLIFARNWDFARLAASAASFAWTSSAVRRAASASETTPGSELFHRAG